MGKPNRRPPNAGRGRKKGVPNKSTKDVRDAIAKVLQLNAANFAVWLTLVAEGASTTVVSGRGKRKKREKVWIRRPDPARAMDLALNMAEYHIPKLSRTEVTGAGGGPVIVQSTSIDDQL